jgi:hypothetical protein
VAAATVAWGLVTLQVTAVATFVHVYQDPAGDSCVFSVAPVGGVESREKVTESMLLGFEALRLYFTELTTKPVIAPVPSPAWVAPTVFEFV